MRIILTGASGLIGSRFEELLFENHEIIPLSSKEVSIINKDSISKFLENKDAEVLVHFAAKTDVDGCEADKSYDMRQIEEIGDSVSSIESLDVSKLNLGDGNSALAVNFVGTKNLYEVAYEKHIKFVYISTDFIFEGNGEYDEDSNPNPINWYGMTKYYGESLIDVSKNMIVRLSFPYGYQSPVKKDFVWKLIDLLKSRDEVSLIEDQTITPTFIDDVVSGLDFLLSKNVTGVYHLTGSSFEDPLEIGNKIKSKLGLKTIINATTRDKLYAGKAARPFKSIMKNVKLTELGFKPKTFDEGLDLILK